MQQARERKPRTRLNARAMPAFDDDLDGYMPCARTSPEDLALARHAIARINEASDEIAGLAEKSHGSAIFGHRMSVRVFKRLKLELESRLSNGKTLAEEFSASGHTLFNNHALKLIRSPRAGLAKLCLARTDGWGRLPALSEIMAGADALHRRHPLLAPLVDDGVRYYVDVTGLAADRKRATEVWRSWQVTDEIARLADQAHYWIEYLGLLTPAMVAHAVSAHNVLSLIAAWVLLEWNTGWQTARRQVSDWYSHQDLEAHGAHAADPADAALRFLLAGYPIRLTAFHWQLPKAFREQMGATIASALRPLTKFLKTPANRQEGALDARAIGNLAAAADWQPCHMPEELKAQMAVLDRALAKKTNTVIRAIQRAIRRHQREGGFIPERDRRPIEPADLLAPEPVRNLAAMELVQTKYWTPFVAQFGNLYDREEDQPGAPMPHAGPLPLPVRLAAAAGSMLLARTLAGKIQLPDAVFAAESFLNGPNGEAHKPVHASVKANYLRHIAFQEVVGKTPGSATPDAWLTWVENVFLYSGGCGVDSVTALVFPAFFFSTRRFDALLMHEGKHFKELWQSVRLEIAQLYPLYRKQDYIGLKARFASIFKQIAELNLHKAEGIEASDDGGTPPPFLAPATTDPFAAPANVFSREHLVLDESSAPIEFERLSGGNPAALQHAIERLKPFVNFLRRLHAQPQIPMPRLRGRFANGLDFDMERVEAVMVGETEAPFVAIDYRAAPRPDVRYTVQILVDFSGSMGRERVGLAKDFALALSLGLKNFDVILYFYSTKGSFYQLIEVFDSRRRKLGGLGALATICDKQYEAGWGWNPDAACLLAVRQIIARAPGAASVRNVVVYLGDMEFCSSLKSGIAGNAAEEVAYACRQLMASGHRLIIGRCGTNVDPLPQDDIPHGYFHLPESGIDRESMQSLYALIQSAVCDIRRN